MKVSFIIPCYASENSVTLVIDEIRNEISKKEDVDYEIIAVNDYSPDSVIDVLVTEAQKDKKIKVIDLAKNRGRHNALICGCNYVTGDYVVFIDDDLQCPTNQLWNLLNPIINGEFDVAIARYPRKKQSAFKNFGSTVNHIISNWLLDKDDKLKFSNFSCMRRFVCNEIIKYKNPYPYLSGLMIRTTSRVCNVDMEERERTIGQGNYTFRKSLSLWLNNFTAFSIKPLRVATVLGLFVALFGFVMGIITVIRKIVIPSVQMGYSSIMATLLFVGGMNMLLLGMLGEYVGRIYMSINDTPQYVIRRTYNIED